MLFIIIDIFMMISMMMIIKITYESCDGRYDGEYDDYKQSL